MNTTTISTTHNDRMKLYEYQKYHSDKEAGRLRSTLKYYKRKFMFEGGDEVFDKIYYNENLTDYEKVIDIKKYNFMKKNNLLGDDY